MSDILTLPAPAKLNRFLHVIGRRADGYHELQTIFQLLDWSDQLSFQRLAEPAFRFTCSDQALETDDNLVVRAVRSLEATTGQTLPVHIHLQKTLPMGGGLGGGSSDAATTLLGLNALFDLKLPTETLISIGQSLGADVPVFVSGHTAWAEGIGERLTPMQLDEHWFVIVHPELHISTPALFRHPELTRDTPLRKMNAELAATGHNDFEPLVRKLYPTMESIFRDCQSYGDFRLTGTGACLFTTAPDKESADRMQQQMSATVSHATVYSVRGCNLSPTLSGLR